MAGLRPCQLCSACHSFEVAFRKIYGSSDCSSAVISIIILAIVIGSCNQSKHQCTGTQWLSTIYGSSDCSSAVISIMILAIVIGSCNQSKHECTGTQWLSTKSWFISKV